MTIRSASRSTARAATAIAFASGLLLSGCGGGGSSDGGSVGATPAPSSPGTPVSANDTPPTGTVLGSTATCALPIVQGQQGVWQAGFNPFTEYIPNTEFFGAPSVQVASGDPEGNVIASGHRMKQMDLGFDSTCKGTLAVAGYSNNPPYGGGGIGAHFTPASQKWRTSILELQKFVSGAPGIKLLITPADQTLAFLEFVNGPDDYVVPARFISADVDQNTWPWLRGGFGGKFDGAVADAQHVTVLSQQPSTASGLLMQSFDAATLGVTASSNLAYDATLGDISYPTLSQDGDHRSFATWQQRTDPSSAPRFSYAWTLPNSPSFYKPDATVLAAGSAFLAIAGNPDAPGAGMVTVDSNQLLYGARFCPATNCWEPPAPIGDVNRELFPAGQGPSYSVPPIILGGPGIDERVVWLSFVPSDPSAGVQSLLYLNINELRPGQVQSPTHTIRKAVDSYDYPGLRALTLANGNTLVVITQAGNAWGLVFDQTAQTWGPETKMFYDLPPGSVIDTTVDPATVQIALAPNGEATVLFEQVVAATGTTYWVTSTLAPGSHVIAPSKVVEPMLDTTYKSPSMAYSPDNTLWIAYTVGAGVPMLTYRLAGNP